ncbi:MAG TPA: outer membrane protein transport protein [bacterium]|nr:outer membrane protein transport protein [bacterium]
MRRVCLVSVLFILFIGWATAAQAGLTFIPNTYGLSAKSIGLGNAMTAVGGDYSAAYFNPAALGAIGVNQIDLNYLMANPDFTGGVKNGEEVEFDTANKVVLIGFTMNLSKLFKSEHGLGLGFDVAVDNNLKSFLNFEERRDDRGQFLRYGLSSVTMITGLGVEILPQLYLGGGGYIMVKGENKLVAETDMAGNTKQEEIQVSAEPAIAPIVSLYAPVHPLITLGATYRGRGMAEFSDIDAATKALVSDSPLTQLNLVMGFKDGYVPQQAAFGVSLYPVKDLMVAVDLTWANWADFAEEVKDGDVVKDDADFETKDTYTPRLGVQYRAWRNLQLRAGYYYEQTPFVEPGLGDAAVLDNDKHVASLGAAYDVDFIPFMAQPLTVGASYFYHHLAPRTVENGDDVEFESSGSLHGVVGSLTLRF